MLESYLFRRSVCGIPSNSLSNTFITLAQRIDSTRYSESLQALLVMLPSYRRFPSDDEFGHELQHRDLYNFRQRNYLLRRLENHRRQERISLAEYTVEHILPQNPQLSAAWSEALGSDWQHVQQRVVHTLGNLTLTRYNSEFRDRSFVDKRDMPSAPEKGLRFSPLHLNADFAQLERWNEITITQRAARLAARAVTIWQAPALTPEVIDRYRTQRPSTAYSINDHPALLTATLYPLFDALRKAVLALDPCISEEFRKLYVAYKAERVLVDVIPLSTTLKITLHAPQDELYDPLQRCRTNSDRRESQIVLATHDDIRYVSELIRQVLDMQLNSE
jgi:predicted transport protein